MNRIARIIKSNNDEIQNFLDKIDKKMGDIVDDYYVLMNNINELFKNYGDVYEQINEVVKLPTKDDIQNIVDMQKNFSDIKNHFNDDSYLDNYIENKEDSENDLSEEDLDNLNDE